MLCKQTSIKLTYNLHLSHIKLDKTSWANTTIVVIPETHFTPTITAPAIKPMSVSCVCCKYKTRTLNAA